MRWYPLSERSPLRNSAVLCVSVVKLWAKQVNAEAPRAADWIKIDNANWQHLYFDAVLATGRDTSDPSLRSYQKTIPPMSLGANVECRDYFLLR